MAYSLFNQNCSTLKRQISFFILSNQGISFYLFFYSFFLSLQSLKPGVLWPYFTMKPETAGIVHTTTAGTVSAIPSRSPNSNKEMCFAFPAVFESAAFKVRFHASSLNIYEFLRWVIFAKCKETQDLLAVARSKANWRHQQRLFTSMFGLAEEVLQRETGTEQVRKVLRTSLSIHVVRVWDSRVETMFQAVFVNEQFPLTYIIARSYFQPVVICTGRKSATRGREMVPRQLFWKSVSTFIPCDT